MKAIMLAAGDGTRCYPFTYLSPKLFQQVGGIPLVEYMLSWFTAKPTVEELHIVVRDGPTAETLRNYLEKRKPYVPEIIGLFQRLGYEVECANPDLRVEVLQAKGWGTGGDLRLAVDRIAAADGLGDDFLVCNADYVIARRLSGGRFSPQPDLGGMLECHRQAKRALRTVMTIALVRVESEAAAGLGVARLAEVGGIEVVSAFTEKPDAENSPEDPKANAGIYLLDSGFVLANLDELLPDRPGTSLERTLLEHLAGPDEPKLAAHLLDLDAWFDVGTLERLVDANVHVSSMKGTRD